MKVFLAGATGALGRRLIPVLLERGHTVIGTTRSPKKASALSQAGAEPVVLDALDHDAVMRAVVQAEPDAIIHQLTALSGLTSLRNPDKGFAMTNRLRTEGTDHLLEAARAAGARRFVAQSYAGWPYARDGARVKTEADALDPHPVAAMRRTLDAIRHVEEAVTTAEGIEGLALRYGGFYGPGTSLDTQGDHLALVRKRRFPVIGDGQGVWSFVHIDDAAAATANAVERGAPGVYNVVDDEPAPVATWLPELAKAAGAKPPRHLPAWFGRLVAGEPTVAMMTEIRGASNAKAKQELGWQPRHATWREGFAELQAA